MLKSKILTLYLDSFFSINGARSSFRVALRYFVTVAELFVLEVTVAVQKNSEISIYAILKILTNASSFLFKFSL